MAYDLKAPPVSAPEQEHQDAVAAWFHGLPEESVTTCDLPYAHLAAPAAACGVRLVGVIRHPFDLFVSNFDVAQQRAARGRDGENDDRTWSALSGQDLASDTTNEYAISVFAVELKTLRDWVGSGNSVRYEDLLTRPAAVLATVTSQLGPLSDEHIARAVNLCPAENVVLSRPGRGRRMPELPPGAWRERLPANLLETLRASYSGDVTALGYDVS